MLRQVTWVREAAVVSFLLATVSLSGEIPLTVRIAPPISDRSLLICATSVGVPSLERLFPATGEQTEVTLPSGQWFVTVKASGYWADTVLVPLGTTAAEVTCPVKPAAILKARVALPKGSTAPEVAVYFRNVDTGFAGAALCPITAGVATCHVPIGVQDVAFRLPKYASVYRWSVNIRAPQNDMGLLLFQRGSTFSGRVEFPDRQTLRDPVEVILTPATSAGQNDDLRHRASFRRLVTRANERGFFVFNPSPGEYVVEAKSGQLISAEQHVTVIDGREAQLRDPLRLGEPKKLTVTVRPPLDPWMKPWTVDLARMDEHGVVIEKRTAAAGAEGICRFSGQMPGMYQLQVRRTERDIWHSRRVQLDEDRMVDADVNITTVHGSISLGEKPLAAWLKFASLEGVRVPVRSDSNGLFRAFVPSVPDNKWPSVEIVSLSPPVKRTLENVTLTGAEDGSATLDIQLSSITLDGRVVDEGSKRVQFALINMTSPDGFQQIKSDDGAFTLNGLPPGHFSITASTREAETESSSEIDVREEGGGQHEISLVVKPITRLSGVVRSNFGSVPGAAVFAFPTGASVPLLTLIPVDAAGEFSVRLPSGTKDVTLTVAAPGFAFRVMRLSLDRGKDVEVAVDQHGGSLFVDTDAMRGRFRPYVVHGGAVVSAMAAAYLSDAGFVGDPLKHLRFEIPQAEEGTYGLCWLSEAEASAAAYGGVPTNRCSSGSLVRHGSLTLAARDLAASSE